MILEIEVTFTAGCFHGGEREWPPSPTRLFQALVAGTYRGAHGLIHQKVRDDALRWLESLPPPEIVAMPAVRNCDDLSNYVPNNDNSLGENAHVRAEKTLGVWTFPDNSSVVFQWLYPNTPEDLHHAEVVAAMAPLISYLGRTADLVYVRGRSCESRIPRRQSCQWQPKEGAGGGWLCPAPGFLELLNRRYPHSVSSEPPDFTNSRQVDYVPENTLRFDVPSAVLEMRRPDDELCGFDPIRLREASGMVRHAMIQWLEQPGIVKTFGADVLSRFIQGHKSASSPGRSEGGHFAVVPLPSLNLDFTADGWLRRVAIMGFGIEKPEHRELFDELVRGLHGASLVDNGRRLGELRLVTEKQKRAQLGIWSQPSCVWRSVTPMILTGWTRRGRSAEDCVMRALLQQGFAREDISSVATFTGPIVPMSQHARSYRVQGYLNETLRVHVEIVFSRPVAGPLIVGRGRFVGFGLLLPWNNKQAQRF